VREGLKMIVNAQEDMEVVASRVMAMRPSLSRRNSCRMCW